MQRLNQVTQLLYKSQILNKLPQNLFQNKIKYNFINTIKQANQSKNAHTVNRSRYRFIYIPIIGFGVTQWVQSVIKNQEKLRSLEFHICDNQNQQIVESHSLLIDSEENQELERKQPILNRILSKLQTIQRFFSLAFYFAPSLFLFPLYLLFKSDKIEELFFNSLVRGIEKAGSLVIKLAQYGSHRSDLMPEKLANKCKRLRDQVPPHQMKHTEEILKKNGLLENIVEIDPKPVASGCIGQVYKAKYKIQDENTNEEKIVEVAIKVRHPNIMQQLKQDLKIVFNISQALSNLPYCKHLQVPVTIKEFNHILINQTDFRIEANNQKIFQNNFIKLNYMVDFPGVYYANEDIIVQEFMQNSRNIEDYVQTPNQVNKRIAKLGTNVFLKMLIYDNFVHADCHAGNLFVKQSENPLAQQNSSSDSYFKTIRNQYNKVQNYVYELSKIVECNMLQTFIDTQSKENREKYKDLNFLQSSYKEQMKEISKISFNDDDQAQQYKLMLIDSGMVTKLSEFDYKYLMRLLKSLICKDSKESAHIIKKMAYYHDEKTYNLFEQDVEGIFQNVSQIPISKINLGQMIRELVESAKARHIQINGNIALLLGNIVILEGLAKQLDPELNIIAEAIPYLVNQKVAKSFID